jgi:hypothetical protein
VAANAVNAVSVFSWDADMAIITEVEPFPPEFSKIDVNVAGLDWTISGRVRFTVKGYARDEGYVSVQNALNGDESEIRIGALPFVIDVAFDNAATKGEALTKAAVQLKTIAGEFLRLADSVLADNPKPAEN